MRLVLALVTAVAYLAAVGAAQSRPVAVSCAGAVSWQRAEGLSGTVTVRAFVFGAKHVLFKSGKGQMTFLDLGAKFPNSRFTVVVWDSNVESLAGRTVCARGKVTRYQGKPELDVDAGNVVVAR